MTCGIYKITNIKNGKFYIGSSENIEGRWSGHISELKRGKHINKHLQYAWNKYGKESFIFEILEVVPREEASLMGREQFYLDMWQPYDDTIGYNISEWANTLLGQKVGEDNPAAKLNWVTVGEIRKKYKEEKMTCKKLAEIFFLRKGHIQRIINNELWRDTNWIKPKRENRGQNQTGENNPSVKLSWDIVNAIREDYNTGRYSYRELRNKYGISDVQQIINNKTWKDENWIKLKKDNIFSHAGETNPSAKLSWDAVRAIREDYKTGNYSYKDLKKKYNISYISEIVRNKAWAE